MDPVVLDAFLDAHTDDQLDNLIKEAIEERDARRENNQTRSFDTLFEAASVPAPAEQPSPEKVIVTKYETVDVSSRKLPPVGKKSSPAKKTTPTPSSPPPPPGLGGGKKETIGPEPDETPFRTVVYVSDLYGEDCGGDPADPLQRRMHKSVTRAASKCLPAKVYVPSTCDFAKVAFEYRSQALKAKTLLQEAYPQTHVYLSDEAASQ
jgi:hypothetical protein